MRTLVIGDIHGGLKALKQVLGRAQVTEDDLLIFLGDYVDGWSESSETVAFLINLKVTHNCVFIRGNHDELCLEWLKTRAYNESWLMHGGEASKASYEKLTQREQDIHISFLENLENYYLDNENRLFLHAGFTNQHGIEKEYFSKLFYWDRTLWESALALNPDLETHSPYYPKRFKNYNEIYIGHTPVTRIGKTVPVKAATVWNIDTGAAFKGPLTVMDVDTKTYWQSDPVYTLYPGENGRN